MELLVGPVRVFLQLSEVSPASQAAGVGFLIVALLAGLLAWYTYRSYKGTENWRLLFVFMAFVVFLLKSVLFVWNEFQDPHPMPHDLVLALSALFDVIVLLLLVIPFFARGK